MDNYNKHTIGTLSYNLVMLSKECDQRVDRYTAELDRRLERLDHKSAVVHLATT